MTPVMRYKDIEIIPTEDSHISEFWKILQSYPNFFSDEVSIKSLDNFIKWFKENSIDSLTAIKNGEVIGCGYLNDISNLGVYKRRAIYFSPAKNDDENISLASISIFVKKRSIKPSKTAPMMRYALPYFFMKHNLAMIYGVTRIDNRACLNLLKMIGLKITGTLKKHKKVKGVWMDYIMSSILREQVI